MKRRSLFLFFLVLCLTALPVFTSAASSGECGPALTWVMDDNGLLTVSGVGRMDSYYALAFNDDVTRVVLNTGVTTIGDCAFTSCNNLKTISIPNTVTSIGKEAFCNCTSLQSVTIPSSVTFLGTGAFRDCPALTRVVLPSSVTVIRDKTFINCNHLTDITLPDTVTSIGHQAFGNCGRLASITIPSSVTYVDMSAFSGCSSLKSVTVLNDSTRFDYFVFSDCPSDLTIYCRSGSTAQKYATDNGIRVELLGDKPIITTQPSSKTVNEGATASFKVAAAGATGYQWYYKKPGDSSWTKVKSKGTSPTYTLTTEARHNGYKYKCKVTNAVSSVYSGVVTLTVKSKPVITTQPSSRSVTAGAKATFKVTATGAAGYQWYYKKPGDSSWTKVKSNGTSATYSLTTEARHTGYKYKCKVTNAVGSVYSSVATLTVKSKPIITAQPSSRSVTAGAKATFKVTATGATGYQWYYKKPGDSSWTKVKSNGTSATYTLTTAARHNGYQYKCKLTNAVGSVYSSVVTLKVK